MVLILKGELLPLMKPNPKRSDREGEGSVAIGAVVGEIVGSPSS